MSLSLDDACNLDGETLVRDGLGYSVVAMVIDGASGKVVNCVKSPVGDGSGVDAPEADEAAMTLVSDAPGLRNLRGDKGVGRRQAHVAQGGKMTAFRGLTQKNILRYFAVREKVRTFAA